MMLVSTNGYILTELGPHLTIGKSSDARITEHMLKSNSEDIRNWFNEGDVLWSLLVNVLPNSQILFAGDYVRIVCSLCNAFRPPIVTSLETDPVIAKLMMVLAKSPNKLQQKVRDNKWDKRHTIWKTIIVSAMPDFPQLNEFKLRDLTMGVYQIHQAKSYSKDRSPSRAGKYKIILIKNKMVLSRPKYVQGIPAAGHTTYG